MLGLNKEISCT